MKNNSLLFSGIFLLMISVFFFTGVFSCRHDAPNPADFPEICFERDVLPIFQTSCALSGCHDRPGGETNYVFNSYPGIIEAVTPGKPESSPAYTSLTAIWSEGMMPPDQPLSLANRTVIRLWIMQGARNTTCTDTITPPPPPNDTTAYVNPRACFQRDIFPVIQSSCALAGCHDGTSGENEFLATSYSSIMRAVVPGKPNESKLYRVITAPGGEDKMPPAPYNPLPSEAIDSIYSWISYGAADEDCGEICDTTSAITWTGVIWPMIQTNCLGCHSTASPSGNVSLASYSDVSTVASSGQLIGALRGTPPNIQMPPSGPLSDCKIRQVEIWIENGTQNNR